MEYQPPPLFKQGPSAIARLFFFSILAIALLVADARFNTLVTIRMAVATALYPAQRAAMSPSEFFSWVGQYLISLDGVQKENEVLRHEKLTLAETALQAAQLRSENDQLRSLLGAREHQPQKSVAAEILYSARDAFSRKVIVDRGSREGITSGQPVIDDKGVIGQVTRVFPFNAEVTLLTDKDHAIPIQNQRSGQRAVAFGGVEGERLELRFLASNADVQKDDVLLTSGLDGVYPPGLPVARVEHIDRSSNAFAKVICVPLAGIDRSRHVLVLLTEKMAPLPAAPEAPVGKRANPLVDKPADPVPITPSGSAAEPATATPPKPSSTATPIPASTP